MAQCNPVPSLEGTALTTITSSLGKVVTGMESTFACGGSISDSTLLISYKKKSGEWSPNPLKLPSTDDTAVQNLLLSCTVASFGIGSQTVTDKDYRDALKLDTDCFITNFDLLSTPIPSTIEKLMDIRSPIRAELYKLNIYCKGGHFKSHVDTPRSGDMFGSLVVSLPSHFTGGELVTRHNGRQVTFDWSRDSKTCTQWGAFFSDVEHEVLPVGSGHRITLTYNLYYLEQHKSPTISSIDVTYDPFYKELQAALHNPHFMRKGGILGFYSQHKYINKSLANNDIDKFATSYLKGPDALIYYTAKSLSLPIAIKPIIWEKHSDDRSVTQEFLTHFACDDYVYDVYDFSGYIEMSSDKFSDMFGPFISEKEITWCQSKHSWHEATGCAMHYGNEATIQLYYQTVALLICIPKYTSQRLSTSPYSSSGSVEQSEAMDFCFPTKN